MRAIRNLLWFLVAFVLTVWAGVASAQDIYWKTGAGANFFYAPSADASCKSWLSFRGLIFHDLQSVGSNGYFSCRSKSSSGVISTTASSTWERCPVAKPKFDYGRNVCVVVTEPPPCPEDSPGTSSWYGGDNNKPVPPVIAPANTPGCVNGCFVKGIDVRNCKSYGSSPRIYCEWDTLTTGAKCTAGDPQYENPPEGIPTRQDVPPFDSPQGPCPKGTVNGGISDTGLQRCIGTGSDPKNKPPAPPKVETEKTETADDGTKTTTKTEVITNSDGSKTTTTTVTITRPDGTKQVDQQKDTSKTPSNEPGKDDSDKDDEKYDLCKQNPNLTICKNSTVAGKCGEISCMGDAIQCATLRAAAAMQCKQQADDDALKASPLNAIGQDAINGTGLDALPNPGNGQIVNLPSLQAQGWLGNGAAFEDVSVSIQGQEVLVPLSKWSQYLLPFRFIMMIIASLISYKILSGAVLRS